MVTLAAAFLAAIIAVLFNNSRISDLRDSVNARFSAMDKRIDDLGASLNQHIDDKFKLLDTKLDHIIEMLATYDTRLTRLENRR